MVAQVQIQDKPLSLSVALLFWPTDLGENSHVSGSEVEQALASGGLACTGCSE